MFFGSKKNTFVCFLSVWYQVVKLLKISLVGVNPICFPGSTLKGINSIRFLGKGENEGMKSWQGGS